MPIVLGEAAEALGVSPHDLQQQSLKALLEKELRSLKAETLVICQKYGVTSWEGMNDLIIEGQIEEGRILEDFQRVDHLTAKAQRLQALLERG